MLAVGAYVLSHVAPVGYAPLRPLADASKNAVAAPPGTTLAMGPSASQYAMFQMALRRGNVGSALRAWEGVTTVTHN